MGRLQRRFALCLLLTACGDSDPQALSISTSAVPDGTVGEAYAAPLAVVGGAGAGYVWSIEDALPPGVTLSVSEGAAALLSGTPMVAGRYEFTANVKDADGAEASKSYTLLVVDAAVPLEVTTTALEPAAEDAPYTATLSAQGGLGAGYSWSISSGRLPDGLSLDASGTPDTQISGAPVEAGNFTFTVEVTDGEQTASAELTLLVEAAPIPMVIETATLPAGSVGATYTAELVASGGSGEGYQWQLDSAPPGLALSSTGTPSSLLEGTPTAAGAFSLDVEVTDALGASVSKTLSLEVFEALSIPEVTLPRGRQGVTFSATIAAADGAGAGHQWQVSAGRVPAGLALSDVDQATVTLSGSPTEFGNFSFTLEVTDAHRGLASRAFELVVDPVAVQITTATVAPGQADAPYSATIETVNGTGAGYAWAAAGLPPGLTIDAAGAPSTTIGGMPTGFGTFTATVTVTDTNGDTDAVALSFDVEPPAVFVTTTALPDVTFGATYSAQISGAQGSASNYQWAVTQGRLPIGLTLDPTGTPETTLSGFAREVGTFAFTVTLVDDNGQTDSAALTLDVVRDLAVETRALPPPSVGEAYAAPLEAAGGTPPYVWTVASGSLPSGLSLAPSTSTVATISGTPTLVAPARFTVEVQDAAGATDARDFLLAPRSAQRWAGTVGDTVIDNDGVVVLADITGAPSNLLTVSPAAPGTGDASTDDDDAAFAPNNNMLAYIGDFLQDGVSELFIVYMATGAPANPTRVSGALVTGGDVVDFKWSPDGQRLLYVADQNTDGQFELFEVEVGGLAPGTPRLVSPPMVSDGDISSQDFWWSPDGRWAVYLADATNDADYELWATDTLAAGPATPVRLHAALPVGSDADDGVIFAPDGSGLVFLGDLDVANDHNIYFVDLRGPTPAAPVQLNEPLPTGADVSFDRYAFSPDGRRLLYVADQRANNLSELFVVDMSFDLPAPPLRASPDLVDPDMDVFSGVWSPDSRRIAFSGDAQTDGVTELFVVDVSGPLPGPARRVNLPLPADGDTSSTPLGGYDWSPDGGWLAYLADTEVDGVNDLLLARMSGLTTTATVVRVNPTLPSGADVDRFLFSPNGQRIVYVADQNVQGQGELFVADLSGAIPGAPLQVNRPMPGGGDVSTTSTQLVWSRDSTRVYYRSDEFADNDFTAWVSDVAVTPLQPSQEVNPSLPTGGDVSFFFLQR